MQQHKIEIKTHDQCHKYIKRLSLLYRIQDTSEQRSR